MGQRVPSPEQAPSCSSAVAAAETQPHIWQHPWQVRYLWTALAGGGTRPMHSSAAAYESRLGWSPVASSMENRRLTCFRLPCGWERMGLWVQTPAAPNRSFSLILFKLSHIYPAPSPSSPQSHLAGISGLRSALSPLAAAKPSLDTC